MAATNDVKIRILVDGKEVDISLDELKKKMQGAGGAGSTAGTSIAGGMKIAYFGVMAAIGAVAGLVIGLGKAVNLASDMNEEVAKMNVVFAGASDKAFEFRDKLHDAYNMSYLEATKLMGRTGDLMTGFGATSDQAADLAFKVNSLSADLVSFKNVEGGVQSASDAITKAMMGERESAKQLGIVIRETDIQARLAADGKNKLTGNAKNLAIAETTLSIIYEQQKNAIGDLERTQDSYANQQRKARAAMEDIGMTIGSILLPLWGKLITAINDFLDWIKPERIAGVLNAAYEVIKTYVQQAIKQFETLNTVLKIMSIAVSEAIQGNFAGAAALTDAAVKYAADSIINMTNEISKAAARGYEEGVNNFHEFLKGMKQEAKESGNIADEMNLDDFKKELVEIKRQYDINKIGAQEYLDLLYEKLGENIKGSEKYLEVQKAITAEEDAQIKKREELQQKYYEDQKKTHENMLALWRDYGSGVSDEINNLVDAQFAANQISYDDYLYVLNQRLLTTQMMYGKESAAYIQAAAIIKAIEADKRQAQITTATSFVSLLTSMVTTFGAKSKEMFDIQKGLAIAQAIINTYEAASKALSAYPPPFSYIAAGLAIAQGLVYVAEIKRQKFTGGGEGSAKTSEAEAAQIEKAKLKYKPAEKVPAMAEGGLVTKPTIALIGEKGPEVVIPQKDYISFENLRTVLNITKMPTSYFLANKKTLNQFVPNKKFAMGGEINQPTFSMLGEYGSEIIAPRKTFIDVTNELINRGMIGGDNTELLNEMKLLNTSISNIKLEAILDPERFAIIAEVGDKIRARKEF